MTSCTGGSGGNSNLQSNPDAGFLSQLSEPSSPLVASDWSGSVEYSNSTGLGQLNAAEGYARRRSGLPGGQGVRIAIIDSGIDVTHPDLGNIAETSWSAGGEALASSDHATFIAGIAGASRTQSSDPNDMHGMAYRATLVNFQASRPSQEISNGGVFFDTDDLVDAIRAASGLDTASSDVESDILNLSLGAFSNNDNTFGDLRTAMRSAASEDKIMVLAAGNEGASSDPDDRLQPIYPAAYADEAGIAGFAIVVGNLTSSDEAASSSSFCGDTQDYCLFAPGDRIQSTQGGGGYGVGSGTSFAAPYVAGAAAVVKAAFPGVSNRDVVDRLLLTAADLGDAGVDSVYGRGRLDLEAAMAPVGPTGLPIGPTVDGPTVSIDDSGLRLGRGLALSAAADRMLGRAMAIDEMGFPFPVDLARSVQTTERDPGLSPFIGSDQSSIAAAGSGDARISAFVSEEDVVSLAGGQKATSTRLEALDDRHVPLTFAAEVIEGTTVFASVNGGSEARLGLQAGLGRRGATWLQSGSFLAAYDSLASARTGGGVSFSPFAGTKVAVAAFTSMTEEEGAQTSLQRFEVMQALRGSIELRMGLGLLQEEGSFIGSRSAGAFGAEHSARSQFMTISLLGPLSHDIDWFTTFSRGRSSIDAVDGSLFGDWSDTQAESFGAGLIIQDLASVDDSLTIMVGQPLRQNRAKATLTLPVARETDGSILTASERIDLAPEGREIATEIGYRLALGDDGNHDIQAAGFLRLNPDHDPDRDPEAGGGLVYRWRF